MEVHHIRRLEAVGYNHPEVAACIHLRVAVCSLPVVEYWWSVCPLGVAPVVVLREVDRVVGRPVVQVVADKTFAGLLSSGFFAMRTKMKRCLNDN